MNFFRKISKKSLFLAVFVLVGTLLAPLFSPSGYSAPLLANTGIGAESGAAPWLIRVVGKACNAGELVQILSTLRVRKLASLQKNTSSKNAQSTGVVPQGACSTTFLTTYCIICALSYVLLHRHFLSVFCPIQTFRRVNPVRAGPGL